jgi:hypothetical protein
MEKLFIAGTSDTPEINFDNTTGKFSVLGRSYPSDTAAFYQPVNTWLNRFVENPNKAIVLEINIEYFHSVSVKFLTNIITKLIKLNSPEVSVSVVWYFEEDDDDNIELAKSLERDTNFKFTYVVLEEN